MLSNLRNKFKVIGNNRRTKFNEKIIYQGDVSLKKYGETLNTFPHYEGCGLYVSDQNDIARFYGMCGNDICTVRVPRINKLIPVNEYGTFKTNRLIITGQYSLLDYNTYKELNLPFPTVNVCCMYGYVDVLRYLYESRIVTIKELSNEHVMQLAAKYGRLSVVKFLLELGIESDDYAIKLAKQNGHYRVVSCLNDARRDI